jgi:hypothetical protein
VQLRLFVRWFCFHDVLSDEVFLVVISNETCLDRQPSHYKFTLVGETTLKALENFRPVGKTTLKALENFRPVGKTTLMALENFSPGFALKPWVFNST